MSRARVTVAVVVALSVAGSTGCAEDEPAALDVHTTVQRVADGDSLVLAGGSRVRLLQIDAPELGAGECHGRAALRALQHVVQPGEEVVLEVDPLLDNVDRHRRLLRYVHTGSLNLNVELVRLGLASPFFLRGVQGRHARALLAAVEDARNARRGMWGRCRVRWDPQRQIETRYP
jgi:micrococcal nuclease